MIKEIIHVLALGINIVDSLKKNTEMFAPLLKTEQAKCTIDIVCIDFEDRFHWMFSIDSANFYATIEDEAF